MIKVERTSPTYCAFNFDGDIEKFIEDLKVLPLETKVTPHTRLGDTEALYVMIEMECQTQPVFMQKGEWILFGATGRTFVTTVSNLTFGHNFKEV